MIFDYWKDPEKREGELPSFLEETDPALPCYILVSHHHKDHFTREIFDWSACMPNLHYVISKDTAKMVRHMLRPDSIWKGVRVAPERVTVLKPGECFENDDLRIDAFGSTDIGNSYGLTIRSASAKEKCIRVFHAGDLNAWIWLDESTDAEVRDALSRFRSIVEDIRNVYPEFDVAMFPVDSRIGREYYTGASIFVREINVKRFIPMHFALGDTPEDSERFRKDSSRFELYANPSHGDYISLQRRGDRIAFH